MHARTLYPQSAVVGAFYVDAHKAKRPQRGQAVLPFEKPGYPGNTRSQRPKHDGTVRNGFIAGYAQPAAEAPTRVNRKQQSAGSAQYELPVLKPQFLNAAKAGDITG